MRGTPSLPRFASGVDGVVETGTDDRQLDDTANGSRMFSPFCLNSRTYLQSYLRDTGGLYN